MEASPASSRPVRSWFRGLVPLVWWLGFVLVLYAYHQHEIWSKRTQVMFTVTLEDEPVGTGSHVTLDGETFRSGQHVAIGKHRLAFTAPEAVPFETNLFVWYGKHDLGTIDLKRIRGCLSLSVRPAAPRLTIQGRYFSLALTNSPGVTSAVPVGTYVITADYGLTKEDTKAAVERDSQTVHVVHPGVGAFTISCNQTGANYKLYSSAGGLISAGELPTDVQWLRNGAYRVQVTHDGSTKQRELVVQEFSTNTVNVEFLYGALSVATDPEGAEILDEAETILGTTPATFMGFLAGERVIRIRKPGYGSIAAAVIVLPDKTNTLATNLISKSYATALSYARTYLASREFVAALLASQDALQIRPGDLEALQLQKQSKYQVALQKAEVAARAHDYTNAVLAIRMALGLQPDDSVAQERLGEYLKHAGQQHEQMLRRPSEIFARAESRWGSDARLFKPYETQTMMKPPDARERILNAFLRNDPEISAVKNGVDREDLFDIQGTQEFRGGLRRFLVTGAQSATNGTHIFYKVMEYKLSGRLGAGRAEVPLDPSDTGLSEQQKKQLAEGLRIMAEKLAQADVLSR